MELDPWECWESPNSLESRHGYHGIATPAFFSQLPEDLWESGIILLESGLASMPWKGKSIPNFGNFYPSAWISLPGSRRSRKPREAGFEGGWERKREERNSFALKMGTESLGISRWEFCSQGKAGEFNLGSGAPDSHPFQRLLANPRLTNYWDLGAWSFWEEGFEMLGIFPKNLC